jgi:outer membrane protein
MLACDSLAYSEEGVALARHQLEQLKYSSEIGLSSETNLAEARAKYDQAMAEATVVQAEIDVKLSALEQIIGNIPGVIHPTLPKHFPLPDLSRDTLENWLSAADSSNPSILAAQFSLSAAREEIRKQRAGHEPTLDIVGSYGRNAQGTGTFPGQSGYDIAQQTLGIQLNVPLFSGGGQQAKVREAIALGERAEQDLETARRSARAIGKQAWFGWQASRARHDAALQLYKFYSLSLESAMLGRRNGIKAELDVLQARQQLSGAWRDMQKARYGMLFNYLRLKATAGQSIETDLSSFSAALSQTNL